MLLSSSLRIFTYMDHWENTLPDMMTPSECCFFRWDILDSGVLQELSHFAGKMEAGRLRLYLFSYRHRNKTCVCSFQVLLSWRVVADYASFHGHLHGCGNQQMVRRQICKQVVKGRVIYRCYDTPSGYTVI